MDNTRKVTKSNLQNITKLKDKQMIVSKITISINDVRIRTKQYFSGKLSIYIKIK